VKRFAPALLLLLAACSGNAPNPRAGYLLQISLDPRFDTSSVTALRIVLDSLPQGPALGLQAGPGETVSVASVSVTSRRTDIDGDGQVEVVYECAQNPWAGRPRFDFPLRSPGYATTPFLLRLEVLGASGVLATTIVDRTPGGKALDFDLGDSVDIPVTVTCAEGRSCLGPGDGGAGDGGAADAGVPDGGGGDGGLPLPRSPLAVSHDTNSDGVDDTLSLVQPGSASRVLLSAARIESFRWSPDGTTLYVIQETQSGSELAALSVADGGAPRTLVAGISLSQILVAPAGNQVAVRSQIDAGTIWHVRPTGDGGDGLDFAAPAAAPLALSPDGTTVAVPRDTPDGGTQVILSDTSTAEERGLLALARLVALAFSPLGGQLAVVGARPGETRAGIHLVSLFGDPVLRLVPDPMAGEVRDVAYSEDGQRLGFRGDLNTAGAVQLYVATPALREVSGGVASDGGGVGQWAFDPRDAKRVAFLSERRAAGVPELYSTGASGTPTRLSADDLDGGVSSFAFSATGRRVAYRTASGSLHVVRGGAAPLDLGTADAFAWSPDEGWLAVIRGTDLLLVAFDGSQTLGPLVTGAVGRQLLWRPEH
jgi:hypothetical protein